MRGNSVLKTRYALIGAIALGLGLTSCRHEQPNVIYMPDMVYSPAIKAQEEGSMKMPVKGTVPRGFVPYAWAGSTAEVAGAENKNPLRPTLKTLHRGQALFNTYCIACHGLSGMGDGTIVPKFPRPPSLHSDKVRKWADGSIYHVITKGQNLMPSYASQIVQKDRWAVIHYVRALQRSQYPTPEDLKIQAEREGK